MGLIDSIRKHPIRTGIATIAIGAGIWYGTSRDSEAEAQRRVLNLPVAPGYLAIGGPNDTCHIEQYVVENERQPHLVCDDGTGNEQVWAIPSDAPAMLNTYLNIKSGFENARTAVKERFNALTEADDNNLSSPSQ